MDPARLVEAEFRIEHRHGDGSWAPMTEVRGHHDAAEHDAERGWAFRRIFRCTRCDEAITVEPAGHDESGGPSPA